MAGEETQEAGFLIDGKEYPIPDTGTFNLDEDQLLWDYAGLVRMDFVPVDPDSDEAQELEVERQRKLQHPGVMRTMLHVAYQRGNPTVKPVVVKRLIGQVNLIDALSRLADEPEDDAGPPDQSALTSEPSESSPNDSNESDSSQKHSPETSGNGSPTGSEDPDRTPASTGTTRSDTSSPASALTP